jgi:hypothetical protein
MPAVGKSCGTHICSTARNAAAPAYIRQASRHLCWLSLLGLSLQQPFRMAVFTATSIDGVTLPHGAASSFRKNVHCELVCGSLPKIVQKTALIKGRLGRLAERGIRTRGSVRETLPLKTRQNFALQSPNWAPEKISRPRCCLLLVHPVWQCGSIASPLWSDEQTLLWMPRVVA